MGKLVPTEASGRLPREVAHNQAVRQRVDLLEQVAADQGQRKGKNQLPFFPVVMSFAMEIPPYNQ